MGQPNFGTQSEFSLLPVRSMREGYALLSSVCVYAYIYIMCVVKKHACYASYCSKISTKTLSVVCSLNLSPCEDTFSAG